MSTVIGMSVVSTSSTHTNKKGLTSEAALYNAHKREKSLCRTYPSVAVLGSSVEHSSEQALPIFTVLSALASESDQYSRKLPSSPSPSADAISLIGSSEYYRRSAWLFPFCLEHSPQVCPVCNTLKMFESELSFTFSRASTHFQRNLT